MYGLAIVQYVLFNATFSYLHKSVAKVTRDVVLLTLISVSHNEILNSKTSFKAFTTELCKQVQYCIKFVTGSAKRGLIADPNCTYLEPHNLPCEYGTTLKLGPTITLA